MVNRCLMSPLAVALAAWVVGLVLLGLLGNVGWANATLLFSHPLMLLEYLDVIDSIEHAHPRDASRKAMGSRIAVCVFLAVTFGSYPLVAPLGAEWFGLSLALGFCAALGTWLVDRLFSLPFRLWMPVLTAASWNLIVGDAWDSLVGSVALVLGAVTAGEYLSDFSFDHPSISFHIHNVFVSFWLMHTLALLVDEEWSLVAEHWTRFPEPWWLAIGATLTLVRALSAPLLLRLWEREEATLNSDPLEQVPLTRLAAPETWQRLRNAFCPPGGHEEHPDDIVKGLKSEEQ